MVFLQPSGLISGAVGRLESRCMRLVVLLARTMARFSSCCRSTAGIAPAIRHRSQRTLTLAEREDISRGIASGSSIREIARGLQRAVSTVGREVARHGGRPLYRASEADQQAWKSALRPKTCLLATHVKLRTIVASKLILDWSPQQIAGWLKRRYPSNESMRVSHETIYRSLFIQARGVLKKELVQHLRSSGLSAAPCTPGLAESPKVRSSMPSPFGSGLQRLKTAPFPVIGREICSPAPATVTSQPWWNDIRVLPSWSKCPAKTRQRSLPR